MAVAEKSVVNPNLNPNILKCEPASFVFPSTGGLQTIGITSTSESRCAFKIKCTNNESYRVKPVYGFINPKETLKVDILRLMGHPKEDKIVFVVAEVLQEELDPTSPFKAGAVSGEVTVNLKAEKPAA